MKTQIQERAEAFGTWYHPIVLSSEYTTKSNMQGSFHQWDRIRAARGYLDYNGKSVLDVGTMDGMWAFEAEELSAKTVVASDVYQANPTGFKRMLFARECRKSNVIPFPNADVTRLFDRLRDYFQWAHYEGQIELFDIIQCFGVLYHLRDPMLAISQLRKCVKDGGKVIIETAVWWDKLSEPFMRFNSDRAGYYDTSTWWLPNKACLLKMLEMSLLIPDMKSIQFTPPPAGGTTGRIAVACDAAPMNSIAGEYSNELGFDYLHKL